MSTVRRQRQVNRPRAAGGHLIKLAQRAVIPHPQRLHHALAPLHLPDRAFCRRARRPAARRSAACSPAFYLPAPLCGSTVSGTALRRWGCRCPPRRNCGWAIAAVASIESEATSRVRVCTGLLLYLCGLFSLTLPSPQRERGKAPFLPLGEGSCSGRYYFTSLSS